MINICKRCNEKFSTIIRVDGKYIKMTKRTYCWTCIPYKAPNLKMKEIIYDVKKTIILSKGTKICAHCAEEKSLNEFNKQSSGSLDGRKSWCKECSHLSTKEYSSRRNELRKQKYDADPAYKAWRCLTARVRLAIKHNAGAKSASTLALIGCSVEALRSHIEQQFQPNMSWNNYGKEWHIDHVIPCAAFDLSDARQQQICFHYTNLQPLWAVDNLKKGSKVFLSGERG